MLTGISTSNLYCISNWSIRFIAEIRSFINKKYIANYYVYIARSHDRAFSVYRETLSPGGSKPPGTNILIVQAFTERRGSIIETLTLKEGELFLSDLGQDSMVQINGQMKKMGRYAVIRNCASSGQLRLLEVSADRDYLLRKYGIQEWEIGRIG